MKTVKKIINVLAWTGDLLPGVLLIVSGVGLIVGTSTGAFWY
jgi:hypothetical protein